MSAFQDGDACGGITIAHLNFEAYGDLPRIFKVGEAEVSWETTEGGWIYIHDMTVQKWPGTDASDPRFDRTFVYGAYWEAGLRIFDVTDLPILKMKITLHTPQLVILM